MDKAISFGYGIRRQPSLGVEGELSELVNLVPKNGELVNVKPMVEADAPEIKGEIFLGVHKVMDGDNYISRQKFIDAQTKEERYTLVYYKKDNNEWKRTVISSGDYGDSPKVSFVGNTMIVAGESSLYYFLWKGEGYLVLGNKIPELELSFGLKTYAEWKTLTYRYNDYFITIKFGDNGVEEAYIGRNEDDKEKPIKEEHKDRFVGDIYAFKNEILKKKRFIWPFFVRYAYRLYDGTLVNHSSPVLMACATDANPVLMLGSYLGAEQSGNMYKGFGYYLMAVSHVLDFQANAIELENWKDIIQSVDIFISPQIPTIDFDGDILGGFIKGSIYKENWMHSLSIGRYDRGEGSNSKYCKTSNLDIIDLSSNGYTDKAASENLFLRFPFNSTKLASSITNTSLFYKLTSVGIDELPIGTREEVSIGDNVLENLETREVMTDGYLSHDTIAGDLIYSYNSRLNIAGVKRMLYDGESFSCLFPYVNGYIDNNGAEITGKEESIYYYVFIRNQGKDIVVGGSVNIGNFYYIEANPCYYFYYPNPNAYKVVIIKGNTIRHAKLTPHPHLYGSYAYDDMEHVFTGKGSDEPTNNNTSIHYPNDIYTSLANNPFVFSSTGINRIGEGEVIGLSTSAKALSQGQFGQFPLYAFCTDGIWALEVASDGSYSAKQPISRDVCNNPDSITQIDGAVVFTTDQGLKMIQGSDVVLLSGNMDGHNVDEKEYFKDSGDKKFFASKGAKFVDYDKLLVQEMRDFREILRECRIAYDYPNNLLRIYPKENKGKYYVFDLGTREFSYVADGGSIHAVIPDYPTSLVQKDTKVYTFANTSDNETLRDGLLLTRPISFGEPYSLKKLHDLRLHYTRMHADSKCYVVMFVSNDNVHWAELTSLRKGSFKYYRFALVTHLTDDDRLSGMVVRYDVERTNKLR